MIYVVGIDKIHEAVEQFPDSEVISITNTNKPLVEGLPENTYRMIFDDVTEDELTESNQMYWAPRLSQIREFYVKFRYPAWDPKNSRFKDTIIHCTAGISRSSACALLIERGNALQRIEALINSANYLEKLGLRDPDNFLYPNRKIISFAKDLGALQDISTSLKLCCQNIFWRHHDVRYYHLLGQQARLSLQIEKEMLALHEAEVTSNASRERIADLERQLNSLKD